MREETALFIHDRKISLMLFHGVDDDLRRKIEETLLKGSAKNHRILHEVHDLAQKGLIQ